MIRQSTLIKRFPLPLYHRNATKTGGGFGKPQITYTFLTQVAEMCTLQPPKAEEITVNLSGLSSQDMFVIRTNTALFTPEDGTDFLGSGVYIPDSYFMTGNNPFTEGGKGGWYNVVQIMSWGNNVINHYKALLVRDKSPEEIKYPNDKLALIETDIDTRDKLFGGNWISGWTQ